MTKSVDLIPASQLFRTLLLHMLDTQRVLTPLVRSTTSKELKWCHQQNVYILSEIESWLSDQIEDMDLTPSYSAAQLVELQVGVVSSLRTAALPALPNTGPTPPSVPPVLPERRLGIRRAPSSRRRESGPQLWERDSTGKIVFRQS